MFVNRYRRETDDAGVTLVVAMMVMGVVTTLSVMVVSLAITTGETTGKDGGRLIQVNAAEAAVDAAYADIQSSALNLPCRWPPGAGATTAVKSYPDVATTYAEIKYYTAASPNIPQACSGTLAAGIVPARAVITGIGSTGTSAAKKRQVQALINLKPETGNGFSKALFGESLVALANNASVTATGGETADIYSNGSFTCDNSPTFGGSIYAANGSITMSSTCTATGDVWARDNVTLSGNKTIGGRVIAAGVTAGTGIITADGNTGVNGTLIAKGNISWTPCTPAKCLKNQSAVAPPPSSPFPKLRGNAATLAIWAAQGYSIQAMPAGTCDGAAGDWIKLQVASITTKKLYTSNCNVIFANTQQTRFKEDVAIFAKGSISTSQQVSIESTDATPHNVHFIQPYDAVASVPCVGSPVMGPSNQFSSATQISLMWYSPCNVSYGNQGGSYGQVYSGSTLTTNNQYTLVYRKVPVFGVDPTSLPTIAYKVDVIYKREDRVG